jgi:hypothetical protein
MSEDYCRLLLEDFLKSSFNSVKVLVESLPVFRAEKRSRQITFFHFVNGRKAHVQFDGDRFYLRSSVEYSNPQLTVEDVQGIIGARLLEVCANYFDKVGLRQPDHGDVGALYELLKKPPEGYVMPFLLNTDDVEADRYSINPLKQSIVSSGQSAYPAAYIKTDPLKIDDAYAKKYDGSLISKGEIELINETLNCCNGSYMDFCDSVKYQQLESLSKFFGMHLSLLALRMPLSTLQTENKDGVIHHIISETHHDYQSIEEAYNCMGRSMKNRTTLLTIPHSKKGYGSKRAARGKIHFQENKLLDVNVKYKTTQLYPNAMDPEDVAVAECDDNFTVSGDELAEYCFAETPSSPQFFLYSIASPEDAAIWHAVGSFGSSQLLQSGASARKACGAGKLIKNLKEKYNIRLDVPLQFNIAPEGEWSHPIHRNIDASIGSVDDLPDLAHRGMKMEYLSAFK